MRKSVAFLLSLFLATDAIAFPSSGGMPAVINAETVTANLASTSNTIPTTFVGISQELSDVILQTGQTGAPWTGPLYTGTNTSLIGLFNLLGPTGHIRIGGNSQDLSTLPNVTSGNATALAAFMSGLGSGWTMCYGLDLGINNSSDAVTQAGLILTAFPAAVFSIGNEPDLYGISEATYQTNWNSYYSALTTAYPSIVLEGPDLSTNNETTLASYTNGLTPGKTGLSYVTFHYYPEGATVNSIATAISDAASSSWSSFISYEPNMRIDEMAAAYGEHVSGTVDRLFGATWYLNVAVTAAAAGMLGVDDHNAVLDGNTFTAPWIASVELQDLGTNKWGPSPIFYGLFLFSKLQGETIAATTKSGTGTVKALSTVGANGNANILVINDDTINPVKITPNQNTAWTSAKVLQIAAGTNTGCTDSTPNVGGAPIGEGGVWVGSPYTISSGGSFVLYPCEAALVQIQP